MKTRQEIAQFYREIKSEDMLGYFLDVLIRYMSLTDAILYLTHKKTEQEWEEIQQETPLNETEIVKVMRNHMSLAWEACQKGRRIDSISNSQKFIAWLFILDDSLYKKFLTHKNCYPYGAPLLAEISFKYKFSMPDEIQFSEAGLWRNPFR